MTLNLTDEMFGNLKAVQKMDQTKRGSILWKCLCKCGKEVVVSSTDLTRGVKTSCGGSECRIEKRKFKCFGPSQTNQPNPRHQLLRERKQRIANAVKSGRTLRDVAREEGVTYQRVLMIYKDIFGKEASTPFRQISKDKWTDYALSLLGKVSDREVSSLIKVSPSTVSHKRRDLNIPKFCPTRDGPTIDRTGEKHGWLEIIECVKTSDGYRWICKCKCGNTTKPLNYYNFKKTISCGCFLKNNLYFWCHHPEEWKEKRLEIINGKLQEDVA